MTATGRVDVTHDDTARLLRGVNQLPLGAGNTRMSDLRLSIGFDAVIAFA